MFRKEVVEAQHQRLFGQVTLTQPPSLYLISFTVFITFIAIVLYLTQAHYSRKESVKGYLLPAKGVVKVYSNRSGVIDCLFVKEGEIVEQGTELIRIKNSQSLSTGVELSVALRNERAIQIQSLERELDAISKMHQKDITRIEKNILQLNKSLSAIKRAKETSKQKLVLKEKQLETNKKLHKKGYLSSSQFDTFKENYFDALEAYDYLDRELINIETETLTLESELLALPEQLALKQTSIQRQISELKAQITELDNQFVFIKKAPESGIVTAIQPVAGSRVDVNTPLLSIIPSNSPLEIELLLPTRSAGFIQLGDEVKVRFDAFPYQKFGFVTGSISNVDKALILPTDKILPIIINEAMYRVRAKLDQQSIYAYGKEFPLKVGMIADVDIILEKRSLLDWLLDPIYAVKGKLG